MEAIEEIIYFLKAIKMVTTYIDARTFLDLVKIVHVAYNREVIGTLFGRHNGTRYYVESVIPAHKINSKPTLVEISEAQSRRLETSVKPFEEWLGYYHSHCEYWNNNGIFTGWLTPSKIDLRSFLEKSNRLLLMFAANRVDRKIPLCIRDDYISGTFNGGSDGKYHMKVKVYHRNGGRHRIGKIVVPKRSLRKIFL